MAFLRLTFWSLLGVLAVALTLTQAARAETRVFQAAGPTAESIQGTVDAYRIALGALNGSDEGPLPGGRREINWDGGGSDVTPPPVTPFDGFLDTRGARFTTPRDGPLAGARRQAGPRAAWRRSSTIRATQRSSLAFSPLRLFTAGRQQRHRRLLLHPGTNGAGARNRRWLRRRLHRRRPAGRSSARPEAEPWSTLLAVLRRRRQGAVQQLRPVLAGRCEPVLLRRHLRRSRRRQRADHQRQRGPGAGRRAPSSTS